MRLLGDKLTMLPICATIIMLLTGCGTDAELVQFKQDMDNFCTAISTLDTSINNVDAEAENAAAQVLDYLDRLNLEFQNFSELDFPEEFDYLEPMADEAAEYMSVAVDSYHKAYADDGYDQELAKYARENSARAFKRIQIIITFLHGDEPGES